MADKNPLNEFAGAYDPRLASERIVYHAQNLGIDPEVALRVAKSEGLYSYTGDQGSSFGPFQLHYGNVAGGGNKVGGLGDVFTRTTGLDARDPRTFDAQIQFALSEAKRTGWGPWHGWKGDKWAGIAGDHPQSGQLYETGRFIPQEQPVGYSVGVREAGPMLPPGAMSPESMVYRAYAPQEQAPSFPSLKETQRQVAQYTPEDIFAGKHLEAPAGAQQQVAPSYTPEDIFAGKHIEESKTTPPIETPRVQQQPEQVVAMPESSWGAPQSIARGYISGLTAGAGDMSKAGATLGAMADFATGNLGPEGFMARRKKYYEGLEEQRKLYEQQHPIASSVAQEAGNIGGLFTPGGLYSRVAGLVGKGVARVAGPETAAFLAGEGGVSSLGTAASKFVRGGAEGIGQTVASQGLVAPEERWDPKHVALSGLAGGVVGAATSPIFGAISAPFKATIAPADRQAAINVMDKHGITVRPSQISQNAKINSLDKDIVPGEVNDKQVEDVTKAVAKMVGIRGNEITPAIVDTAARKHGELLDKIAQKTTFAPVTPNLGRDLLNIENKLARKWGQAELDAFRKFKTELMNELTPSNYLAGERYRYFVRRNGGIDRNLFTVNPQAAHEVRDAFEKMFQMTAPAKAALYQRASDRYKLLDGLQDIVQNHGKLDPTKLAAIAQKKGIGGDFAELAEIGKKMSSIDVNGLAKVRAKSQYKTRLVEALGAVGPAASAYLGATTGPAAVAGASAAGLHYMADILRHRMLTSPQISREVLIGQPSNLLQSGRGLENVLTGGAGQMVGGVGFGGNQ